MDKFSFDTYDFKRNLLFTWPTGVGKTYQAEQLIETRKKEDQETPELLRAYTVSDAHFKQMVKSNLLILRSAQEWQSSLAEYPLELMLRVKVLLYDDIGVSDVSEAYLRDFTYIIDERIKKGLTTIFTTNLKRDELKAKLNERIVSRILFNTDVIIFDGEDRRLKTTNFYNAK